jgi:hypothetical protein
VEKKVRVVSRTHFENYDVSCVALQSRVFVKGIISGVLRDVDVGQMKNIPGWLMHIG